MPAPTNYAEEDALLAEILQRSATDHAFRQRLLAEPNAAVEEVIGAPLATLPKQVTFKFIEKEPGYEQVVVLPDYVDPDGVLSDAELEAVAGGNWCITSCSLSLTFCRYTDDNKVNCPT